MTTVKELRDTLRTLGVECKNMRKAQLITTLELMRHPAVDYTGKVFTTKWFNYRHSHGEYMVWIEAFNARHADKLFVKYTGRSFPQPDYETYGSYGVPWSPECMLYPHNCNCKNCSQGEASFKFHPTPNNIANVLIFTLANKGIPEYQEEILKLRRDIVWDTI